MDHKGSGFVSDAAGGIGGSGGGGGGKGKGGGSRGLPGFSAVDEDESESGVFSDKDFRNMSLKVGGVGGGEGWGEFCGSCKVCC